MDAIEENHCLVQYSLFDVHNFFSVRAMPLKMPHCWKSHVVAKMVIMRVDRPRPGSLGFNIACALMQETLTLLLANNKGTDQPAHPCSLICAFVTCYLKRLVTRSDISHLSIILG